MRNKIVKQMRRAMKPLVKAGTLSGDATYDDEMRNRKFFRGFDDKGLPIYMEVPAIFKRTLKATCLKYHIKTMKRNYKMG